MGIDGCLGELCCLRESAESVDVDRGWRMKAARGEGSEWGSSTGGRLCDVMGVVTVLASTWLEPAAAAGLDGSETSSDDSLA